MEFFKNYKNIILLAFFLFLALIFFDFLANLSFPDTLPGSPKTDETKLYPKSPVFQIFTATENNLERINIGTKNIPDKLGSDVLFQLSDETCDKILAESKFGYFSFLSDPKVFKFTKIPDSKDKKYCLKVTYLGDKKGKNGYPSIETSNQPADPNASYTNTGGKGGENKGKTLKIEPAYSGTLSENLNQLNQRISQYKPWFLKGNYLFAIFALFLICSAILVITLVLL